MVGQRHLKLTLKPERGERPIEAIAFNTPELPPDCRHAHLAYRLEVNEFRGLLSPQLVVEHVEVAEAG